MVAAPGPLRNPQLETHKMATEMMVVMMMAQINNSSQTHVSAGRAVKPFWVIFCAIGKIFALVPIFNIKNQNYDFQNSIPLQQMRLTSLLKPSYHQSSSTSPPLGSYF
jgi:hypothetical protein